MKKTVLTLISFVTLSSSSLFAQTATTKCETETSSIRGIYYGKNLFLHNNTANGIQKITVNNNEIKGSFSTVFEIVFSKFSIAEGTPIEIKITSCKNENAYKIMNPDAIKAK